VQQLAARGWQVRLIDRHHRVASEASGNSAAVLYARTAAQRATLADFYEASLHYAHGFYQRLLAGQQHGLNGLLVLNQQLDGRWLANNPENRSRQNVTAEQASKMANIRLDKAGIFYAHSGYLQPSTVCQQLLDDPSITFSGGHAITHIEQLDDFWQVRDEHGFRASANVLVLAAGNACQQFAPSSWLPSKALRGQTTDLPALPELAGLALTLCEQGYCTPLLGHIGSARHAIGATYNLDYQAGDLRDCDHRENLEKIGQMLALDLHSSCPANLLGGRASLRCVSPDYLPMVGNMVQHDEFLSQFARLSSNARQTTLHSARLHKGLYVNTAYGSQGFSMAPLASEILAAEISGEPVPIGDTLRQALSPTRFLVRQLIRSNPEPAG